MKCILLFVLTAGIFSSVSGQTEAYRVSFHDFSIGTFNDSWGGGFTEIHDDWRSFGFKAEYAFKNKFACIAQSSGLTNKSSIPQNYQYRTDELLISARYLVKKEFLDFVNIYASGGMYYLGKLGGEKMQNITHNFLNVKQVKLPYENYNLFSPSIGIYLNTKAFRVTGKMTPGISSSPDMLTQYVPAYFYSLQAGLPLSLESKTGDKITVRMGYQYVYPFTNSPLLVNVLNKESGPFWQLKADLGFLSFFSINYPSRYFSSGGIALAILKQGTRHRFKNADAGAEFGSLADANGFNLKFSWNQTGFLQNHFMFTLTQQSGVYHRREYVNYPFAQGHYAQTTVGGEIYPVRTDSWFPIIPYLGINGGIVSEYLYSGSKEVQPQSGRSAVISGEGGVKFKCPGFFLFRNTRWGLSMFYKINKFILSENHREFQQRQKLEDIHRLPGVGIFILTDL